MRVLRSISQQHGLHAKLDAQIVGRRRLRPLGVVARGATQRNIQLKGATAIANRAGAERGRFKRARNDEKLFDERPLPTGREFLSVNARAQTRAPPTRQTHVQ